MLESLSIEALAHYTRGMATLFFVLWAIKIAKYRHRDNLVKVLFIAICFTAFGFLKDVVFMFTPLMEDMFVMNVVSLIDITCTPFVCAFFFEAARPGVVTVKRFSPTVVLFVILIPIYIILRNETVVTVAYILSALVSLVSFVLIMIYVSRYDRFIENNYSYTLNINVRWVGSCATAYFSWFVVYVLCFNDTTWASEVFFDVFSISIWYVLVYFTDRHRIVVGLQELKESEAKTQEEKSWEEDVLGEKNGEAAHGEEGYVVSDRFAFISEKLHQKMDLDKVYLDPNLSLVSLASEIGSNRSYLSEYINHSGKTFYEYINDYRISEACRLIDESASEGGRLTLGEISTRSGFNSISSFNRHFYKIKSMTPSAYLRRQLLDKQE
ncbi:MAG: helix-turn-helix domain-containing protein [Prevotella sp.]